MLPRPTRIPELYPLVQDPPFELRDVRTFLFVVPCDRARLDALYFHLYGIGRDDADYILSTFPIVERHDRAAHGRYLTRDLILAWMNALAAGEPDATIVLPAA